MICHISLWTPFNSFQNWINIIDRVLLMKTWSLPDKFHITRDQLDVLRIFQMLWEQWIKDGGEKPFISFFFLYRIWSWKVQKGRRKIIKVKRIVARTETLNSKKIFYYIVLTSFYVKHFNWKIVIKLLYVRTWSNHLKIMIPIIPS